LFVHIQNPITKTSLLFLNKRSIFFIFACKALGFAGEIDRPLSFVDEILPDGLISVSLPGISIVSALYFRLFSLVLFADVDGISS
jgi:hypothetical protein